jgi:3-isopropylmalate dehydrogenase
MAAVLSAAMMCDWLGERFADERLGQAARALEGAVASVLAAGAPLTYDLGGAARGSEVGAAVARAVEAGSRGRQRSP